VVQDVLGDAPEPPHRAPQATTPEHDDVRLPLVRLERDLVRWVAEAVSDAHTVAKVAQRVDDRFRHRIGGRRSGLDTL
jgi:hypothetical protein